MFSLFCSNLRAHNALGGDKSGDWDIWYEWAVLAADDLYDIHLAERRDEGVVCHREPKCAVTAHPSGVRPAGFSSRQNIENDLREGLLSRSR